MLIDWFTVGAQIVNFLILLVLLKYLLYDRIVRAMERREERIQSRRDDAEERMKEVEREKARYDEKLRALDEERQELLDETHREAELRRKEMLANAREETRQLQEKWRQSVEQERETFIRHIRGMAGEQVFDITRRTLADLADADLQDKTVDVFLRRFERMPDAKKSELISGDGPVAVRSGFEMNEEQRQRIADALKNGGDTAPEIDYAVDHDLILGIELKHRDKKIAWTVESYLMELEQRMQQAFEKEIRRSEPKKLSGRKRSAETAETEGHGEEETADRKALEQAEGSEERNRQQAELEKQKGRTDMGTSQSDDHTRTDAT